MRFGGSLINPVDRRVMLVGMLLCLSCLAYFHMLDAAVFSSAGFSPIFKMLVTVYDSQTAWIVVGVCFLATLWNRPEPVLALVDLIAAHPFVSIVTAVSLMAAGSVVVYHQFPFSMDEYAAVFQAKIFATGHVSTVFAPGLIDWLVWPGFNGSFLIASRETGRVIEGYWPGFSLLLAPFEFLNIPWLCNPLLAGASLCLMFRITLDITGERRCAGWAVLLALASGAFFVNAISFYSMNAHLAVNLLYAWLLMSPTRSRALLAGVVGSFAMVLHNPFPHVLFALPWVITIALHQDHKRFLPALILGYLPLSVILGLGWLSLRTSIVHAANAGATWAGIISGVFSLPDATSLNMRLAALVKMWIWAVPCLLLLATIGRRRFGANRAVRLLGQSALMTFAGYLFVNVDQGHGWGFRYFHSAWGVVPILAACAMAGPVEAQRRLVSFAGAAAAMSFLIIVPFQLFQVEAIVAAHLDQLPLPKRPGNNVYLVKPGGGFYLADLMQIDPQLRGRDLLLATRGESLDTDLVRRNWPNAIKVTSGIRADQWYLGAADQRISSTGNPADLHFVLASVPGPGIAR